MVSEKKIFKHFYENLPFLPPRQPIKFTDLDKSHMKRRGLLNKHFCKKQFKLELMFMKHYAPNRCLYIKVDKIKNWGGECRDVTPTKSLSHNIRVDVNREVKFL